MLVGCSCIVHDAAVAKTCKRGQEREKEGGKGLKMASKTRLGLGGMSKCMQHKIMRHTNLGYSKTTEYTSIDLAIGADQTSSQFPDHYTTQRIPIPPV